MTVIKVPLPPNTHINKEGDLVRDHALEPVPELVPEPVPTPLLVPEPEPEHIQLSPVHRPAPTAGHWQLNALVTADNYEQFIHISDVAQPSYFKYQGCCLKCGYASLQPDEKQAHDIVVNHITKHFGRP